VKTLNNLGQGAGRMAVSLDGRWAASTHSGSQDVAIIDAMKKEVAATVKLGRGPGVPVFLPDGAKLYVMNFGEGDVAVIDLKSTAVRGSMVGLPHP
jgi:DNA-binding beta-propeller fold protein YncE